MVIPQVCWELQTRWFHTQLYRNSKEHHAGLVETKFDTKYCNKHKQQF